MISEEIKNVAHVLGRLEGDVTADAADTIRRCQQVLLAAAGQAEELEKNLYALAQDIEERIA